MLKNIIFDMGNVLVRFDPYFIIEAHDIKDPQDRDILLNNIFFTEGWKKMDLGVYVEDDLYNEAIITLPQRLHLKARELLNEWYKALPPIEGMKQLISELKDQGLGIYLLSNAGRSKDIYWKDIPGSEYFDGTVVSAFEGCIKPDEKIYRILLERYSLKPEDSLFIDDMKANIEGAQKLGINTYLFDGDVKTLKNHIFEMLKDK